MKNLKNILVLVVITVALYSCNSDVTIDDPKTETIENISPDTGIVATGNEGNEEETRGEGGN
tara:strand:- start:727632 stop:727817 length:186 start_codon:yes stop_codon:yes gene_type:complete